MKRCTTLTWEGVCKQKLTECPLLKIRQEFENLDTLITLFRQGYPDEYNNSKRKFYNKNNTQIISM